MEESAWGKLHLRHLAANGNESMHELSIAMSIVELAEEEASERGVNISAVHLKLGPLSGVVKSALLSAYEMACEQTALAGSQLIIEEVPIVVHCPKCEASRTLASMQWFCCPECGNPVSDVLHGRELLVTALEVREMEVPA
jgi:hydrogenase nickel incorporation protein HypA/HybF